MITISTYVCTYICVCHTYMYMDYMCGRLVNVLAAAVAGEE
jgi:hypothetical protein